MMMKAVVDASVIIHWLRTGDDSMMEQLDGVISVVTVAELFSGASAQKGGRQREAIENLLEGWVQISPSSDTAILIGELKYAYRLSLGDAFVAALALEQDLPLATLDSKAFQDIKGLKFYGSEKKRGA